MWVGKFKIQHDDWVLEKTVTHNISVTGVPLSSFHKNGKHYHTAVTFVHGKEKNKNDFITSVKNDARVAKCSVHGDQLLLLIEGEDAVSHAFDASLFFVQPVLMKEGYEFWEIGSWEKKNITAFFEKAKDVADVQMLKLRKENPGVFVQHSVPTLTAKQRTAFDLAQAHGYYEYPRRVSVKELAEKMNVPRTTLQEHLRKAEAKIMRIFLHSTN
ncbi:MAG: helix-turn-helix domain-containing protein [Candidatus Woesearchaeota archaeon]|nr:helix-turn-helix domain-containing protein [Candidatus Woesearchaeota archaeon]